MFTRNGPVIKSVESVLRPEGSLWWERFVKEVGLEPMSNCNMYIIICMKHFRTKSYTDAITFKLKGRAMKAQKTATKTQMYFQQKRKRRINKTATCNSKSATSSVSIVANF